MFVVEQRCAPERAPPVRGGAAAPVPSSAAAVVTTARERVTAPAAPALSLAHRPSTAKTTVRPA